MKDVSVAAYFASAGPPPPRDSPRLHSLTFEDDQRVTPPAALVVAGTVRLSWELERFVPTAFCPLSAIALFALVPCGLNPAAPGGGVKST